MSMVSNPQPAPSLLDDTSKPKRKYSKNGCRECKRRKMKCDETKPNCWQCSRLDKPCVYDAVKENKSKKRRKDSASNNTSPANSINSPSGPPYDPGIVKAYPTVPMPLSNHFQPLHPVDPNSKGSLSNILNTPTHNHAYNIRQPLDYHMPFTKMPVRHQNIPSSGSAGSSTGTEDTVRSSSISLLINHDNPTEKPVDKAPLFNGPKTSMFGNGYLASQGTSNSAPSSVNGASHDFDKNDSRVQRRQSFDVDLSLLAQDIDQLVNSSLYMNMHNSQINEQPESAQTFQLANNRYANNVKSAFKNEETNAPGAKLSDQHEDSFNYKVQKPLQNTMLIPHVALNAVHIDLKHRRYLEAFYYDFARIILPFEPYHQTNPVRDIMLSQATGRWYLLNAILACGARSRFIETDLPQDRQACNSYLTTCYGVFLKTLEDEKQVNREIEPILLTVLLLTSYNAASKQRTWRTHMKGAKDLLKKYAISSPPSSPILVFCVHWFATFELLVGLNNPYMGTLDDETELDLLLDLDPQRVVFMKKLDLITPDNFNLLFGSHNAALPLGKDVVKLLNRLKKNNQSTDANISVYEVYELIGKINAEKLYQIVSQDGIILDNHALHWKNFNYQSELSDRKLTSDLVKGVAMIYLDNGVVQMFSWYDIAHQSFVLTLLLIISTKIMGLPQKHPLIIELVNDILKLMYFLDYIEVDSSLDSAITFKRCTESSLKYYFMLVQWQILYAGLSCTDLQKRTKIATFFKLMAQIGVGSATYNLKKLNRHWSLSSNAAENANLSESDEADVVTY